MSKIAKIILAQNDKLPGDKKLHKSFFSKELKKKDLDVEISERTDPVRYLKYGNSLYGDRMPTFAIVNTSGVKFEFTKRFGYSQLHSAEDFTLKQARAYYPRIIFFESHRPELDEQTVLDKLSTQYSLYKEAGIAEFSASEEKTLEEILKMLELISQSKKGKDL